MDLAGAAAALAAVAWAVTLLALAVLALYGAHRLHLAWAAWGSRRATPAPLPPLPADAAAWPVVTVQLPLFNEPAVAARLVDAAAALDWPAGRLEVQVLDDSTDGTSALVAARVAHWRARGADVVHLRRTDRAGYKAGALEAGRLCARGALLLVLDADFVPAPDLLVRTVPHFADPTVGMVQVRWDHLNRGPGLLTELEAVLLDGHFAVEQRARASRGAVFNFNGTAGLWRAEAITSAGGWHADTLTEDLDLSYRAALAGWRFVYAGDVVVPAELPADVLAFKSQQHRWAKGSIECARKLAPTVARARWRWRHKLEAALHLGHNLPYLITLLVLVAGGAALAAGGGPALARPIHLVAAAITIAVLATFVAASQRGLGRSRLGALARVPALMALTAGLAVSQSRAIVSGLLGHASEFVRTPKDGATGCARRPASYRVPAGSIVLAELGLGAYLAICAGCAAGRGLYGATAMLAWLGLGAIAVGVSSIRTALRST